MARRSASSFSGCGVAHGHPVDVGHRQGEAGPLQQARGVVAVGEGRDARARAAQNLRFGLASATGEARSGSRRPGWRRGTGRRASARGGSGSGRPPGRWSSAGRGSRPPGRGSGRRTAGAPRPAHTCARARPASMAAERSVSISRPDPLARRAGGQGRGRSRRRARRGRRQTGKSRTMASRRSTRSSAARRFRKSARRSPSRRGPGGGGAGRGRTGGAGRRMSLRP